MLQVKTSIQISQIHGIGLFAEEWIPQGTLVFQEDILTIEIPEEKLQELSTREVEYIKRYGYLRGGVWRCSADNDKFTNHSDNPNLVEKEGATYALRDIQPGEELLANYQEVGCISF